MGRAEDVCSAGRSSIQAALEEAAARSQKPLAAGMVSLIQFSKHEASGAGGDDLMHHEVIFVKWESVGGNVRRARRVRLDSKSRVIFNVPYVVPVEEFPLACTSVVVRDVPVLMLKVKGKLRDPMPEFALTLQMHLRAQHFAGPLHADEGSDLQCVLCEACSALGLTIVNVDGPGGGLFQCCQCSMMWHAACASYICVCGAEGLRLDGLSFVCPACLT